MVGALILLLLIISIGLPLWMVFFDMERKYFYLIIAWPMELFFGALFIIVGRVLGRITR